MAAAKAALDEWGFGMASVRFICGTQSQHTDLERELSALLGAPAVSYGKGAIVGVNGEMEHGGACVHPMLGRPMRAAVGGGEAVIPSNVKVAAAGAALDHGDQQVRIGVALRRMQHEVHAPHAGRDPHRAHMRRTFVGPERELHR